MNKVLISILLFSSAVCNSNAERGIPAGTVITRFEQLKDGGVSGGEECVVKGPPSTAVFKSKYTVVSLSDALLSRELMGRIFAASKLPASALASFEFASSDKTRPTKFLMNKPELMLLLRRLQSKELFFEVGQGFGGSFSSALRDSFPTLGREVRVKCGLNMTLRIWPYLKTGHAANLKEWTTFLSTHARPEVLKALVGNGYSQQTAENALTNEWSSISNNALSYINSSLRGLDTDLEDILAISAYELPLNLSSHQATKLREAMNRGMKSRMGGRLMAIIEMRSIQAGEEFPAGSPAEELYQAIINWKKLRPY